MEKYNHKNIETKWQEIWEKEKLYQTSENQDKPKYYVLDMFPYPSGAGLHVGHPKGYIATDIFARAKMMQGYNVLHPMGWDAFGLPAENYAIQNKIHPKIATENNIETFKNQLEKLGFTYDWGREINTTDPEYYKWTQWTFIKMFERGLAYESNEPVNWCPSCKTVLSNEDLENGKCERCGSEVEQRPMRQWVLKITDYADRLLNDLEKLPDWEESIKEMQKNWIGKSEGAIVKFPISSALADEPKKKVLLGTRNSAKIKMLKACFAGRDDIEFLTLDDINVDDSNLAEGDDFIQNARLKSEFYFKKTGIPTLSTDHGLWIEKWPENNGFIVHIRKLANSESPRATDREVVEFLKKFLKSAGGESAAHFDYAMAYTDASGTQAVNQVPHEYILQTEEAKDFWEGYPVESLLRDPETRVFKSEQSDEIRYGKVAEILKKKIVPLIFKEKAVEIFTTRLDTIFGCTYLVVAPEHRIINKLKPQIKNWPEVEKYFEQAKKKTNLERMENKEKTGVRLEGVEAVNPFNNQAVPVFMADYVLAHYGTGAIMAVPAHDERDWEFAKKYDLPIKQAIASYHLASGNHPDAVREKEKTVERNLVYAVVKHWNEDKYLCLDWKNEKHWTSMVVGGVEEDETLLEAGRREILEETGYKNFKFIKEIELSEIHSYFYASHKNENRYAKAKGVYVELLNGEKDEVVEAEKNIHTIVWVAKDKVKEFLAFSNWRLLWDIFLGKVKATVEDGILINSGKYSGLKSEEAREKMAEWLEKENLGKRAVNYKIKDWVFSRQRYWGEPIPIVRCEKCGSAGSPLAVPVPEKELPLKLPEVKNYEPTGTGESPLANIKEWVNTICPKCGGSAKRETNTMPQWAGSSWYYLRYIDPRNNQALVDKTKEKYWSPVDFYVGGAEHATRHLIYARFWHKFLFDIGAVNYNEPFTRLQHVGLILAEDGRKMSKRWNNVINPDEIVEKYGADAMRVYEMFMGPFSQPCAWSTNGLIGARRFLENVYKLKDKKLYDCKGGDCKTKESGLPKMLHKTIKKVTEDIENFHYNTAIAQMMTFVNFAGKFNELPRGALENFLKLLAPFAPHLAEELWSSLAEATEDKSGKYKKSIFKQQWPAYDPKMIKDETINLVIQINGRVREAIEASADIGEEEAKRLALENEKIKKWLLDKEIVKIIFIKGRLVNIVVKD